MIDPLDALIRARKLNTAEGEMLKATAALVTAASLYEEAGNTAWAETLRTYAEEHKRLFQERPTS